jgi:P pilus assembly chaperone PapD
MNRRMVNQRSNERLLSALLVSTLLISTALTAQATSGPTRITMAAQSDQPSRRCRNDR